MASISLFTRSVASLHVISIDKTVKLTAFLSEENLPVDVRQDLAQLRAEHD